MNLLFFIRLLVKHIIILVTLPVVLAVMVFYLTKNQPQQYTSSTRVYTGITTGSSIVSLESSKVDLFATRTAFDNLISVINARSTVEEVSLQLLATHLMLDGPDPEIISAKSYEELMNIVPGEVKQLVVKNNLQKTIENFRKYKDSGYDNFIYELINFSHPDYSSQKISSKIRVRRVQSSDLVDISYSANDPGICKGTLDILTHVFISEYAKMKVNQSDAVVKYFERQLELSNDKLNEAENELLVFNQENVIINYYEQTKHIAAEKELFEMRYLEIRLENAGAKSVIEALENKMSVRQKQRVTNENVSGLRHELAQINLDIAVKTFEGEVDSTREEALVKELGELRIKAFDIEQKLKEKIREQYFIDNSTEGVATQSLLEDWVDNVINYEATQAQINVAEIQRQHFTRLFESYAPLGATMKRLERKIDVAEREYLSLLHSLGVAKLNQQNIELTSNLKIVAEPLFPIVPEPSKRKFLIMVAFVVGFVIPAFVVILLEFLDQNLRTANRAQSQIGLNVAAIFPKLLKGNKKIDFEFVKERGLDVIARRLILNTENNHHSKPDTNILFSILDSEGKTMIASMLLQKLAAAGYKVLYLPFAETQPVEGVEIRNYSIDTSFHRTENIHDLNADFTGLNLEAFDYIFVEIPAILTHTYPINLFKNTRHSFLVTRANRAWTKSDTYALKDIIEFTNDKKPQVILNGVEILEMETVIGDLPKKRSWIRKTIKNAVRFQFFSRNKLK